MVRANSVAAVSTAPARRVAALAPGRLLETVRADLAALGPRLAGTLGTSSAIAVLGLVSGTIAARALGPTGRGELAQLLLWPQIVATLGVLGVDLAATYFSADPKRRAHVPTTVLALALLAGVPLIAVYLALVPFVFADGLRGDALLTMPLIHIFLVSTCMAGCLSGSLRFRAFNTARIATPLLYCAGIFTLWRLGALTPRLAALAFVAASAAAALLAWLFVRAGGSGRFDHGLAGDMVSYGVRGHLGRLTPQLLSFDVMMVALLLSPADVGLFVVAAAFLAAPSMITGAIVMVLFPHVSAQHLAGERPRFHAMLAVQLASVTAVAALLVLFARPAVVLIFGDDFAAAVAVLRLLAIGSVAVSARSFLVWVIRGLGRPGLTSVVEAAHWLLFLLAVPAGAALGGLTGTAVGVLAAAFVSLAVLLVLGRDVLLSSDATSAVAAEAQP